ncbi:toxin-antitoxin system HicB family antitoxin [Companilactobacillus paralimentarius]|uniref:toxin-antitoxin system HicB family antitoxin n=1 Tax=Companilactobacillus paralimentarius TaxID=83526 RepID=UPI0028533252|nr:toxin-antitoxin system HicB family antitoxin [Companilactobacillus paralimentarius]MDR4932319.1 toxin-antitoxin system HicB family antitoxin [Companilactobacillus paralimentarius]
MADKMIALRLDKDLYDRIAEDAGRENRSVNNYIVTKLSEAVPTNNLERRQIVGSIVRGDKINMANDLVEVKGIYYRYDLLANDSVNTQRNYQVIKANGNILTIQELK